MPIKKLSLKCCLLLIILAAFSQHSHADTRQEAWYTTVEGDYNVREALHGEHYASLGMSRANNIRIYIELYSPEHCRKNGERLIDHDPVYINGTLVKMAQHCQNGWNIFFAPTDVGSDYLIDQFKKSRSVEIKTLSGDVLIFSAMGFLEHYRKMLLRGGAL